MKSAVLLSSMRRRRDVVPPSRAGDEETVVIRYVRRIWLSGRQDKAGMLAVPDVAFADGEVAGGGCAEVDEWKTASCGLGGELCNCLVMLAVCRNAV